MTFSKKLIALIVALGMTFSIAFPVLAEEFESADEDVIISSSDESEEEEKEEKYTGIHEVEHKGVTAWWRIVDDEVDDTFTGLAENEYGWWYLKDGKVDFDKYGLVENEYGWWRVENGQVNFYANGVYENEYGWWKCTNGQVDFSYTGLAQNEWGWWAIENGRVNFDAYGIVPNEYGWWKVSGGAVDFSFDGLAQNEFGWWKFNGGAVDFSYTGLAANEYGVWFVRDGNVRFNESFTYKPWQGSFKVQNGSVKSATLLVPLVNQNPKYPTGCEAASATMLLNFYGVNVGLDEMVNAIPRENLQNIGGKLYGPDITKKFVGDPKGTYTSGTPGYGAFAPVVTSSVNNVLKTRHDSRKAYDLTGWSADDILKLVKQGTPAIVWSTYNMNNPTTNNSWYIKENGGERLFSYPRGTHVCVISGCDDSNVYLSDPYGAVVKKFSISSFKSKYNLLGKQAVIIK